MKVTQLELTSCFFKVCLVGRDLCCGSWTGAHLDLACIGCSSPQHSDIWHLSDICHVSVPQRAIAYIAGFQDIAQIDCVVRGDVHR